MRVRPFGHTHFCPISTQPYLTDSVRHFPALRPSYEASAQYKQQYGPKTYNRFSPSLNGSPAAMASADFCQPIPKPLSFGSTVQVDRSPRVRHATFTLMPAAFTSVLSVQVSGFEDIGLLTQYDRLIYDFCSSSQCFACGFLQPIPHDINLAVRLAVPLVGPAEDFHLQVVRLVTTTNRTVPVTALRAMPGTPKKKRSNRSAFFIFSALKPEFIFHHLQPVNQD